MYHVVMGDIIGSSGYPGFALNAVFHDLIGRCNAFFERNILSPYTITLGDEFQGVLKNLPQAIETLFFLEENLLRQSKPHFKLRYVIYQGEIDTPINRERAHGMLGEGLTGARELLLASKEGLSRFRFHLADTRKTDFLNKVFFVIGSIIDHWSVKDYHLIYDMLEHTKDNIVADLHGRHRTSVMRRRETLMIREYQMLKGAIHAII